MKRLVAAAAAMAAAFASANPLGFAQYEQTVEAEFGSAAEAEAATLEAVDLPGGAKTAFTSRWDDSTAAHVAKGEMLASIGVYANFYLNGGADSKYLPTHGKKLLEMGHALGNHSVRHPQLMEIPANAAWAELLLQKIAIETKLSFPCVSFAAPYSWGKKAEPGRWELQARMLQATGHYVCDDYPVAKPGWDFAKDAWFETARYGADDRQPSREKYAAGYAHAMRLLARRPELMRITFGIHSWCSAEGTKLQGEMIKETLAEHPDWVCCNANKFGAHRYSARFANVRKVGTDGAKARWEVTRYDPVELGDGVALSVKFGKEPKKCGLKAGKNGTWELEHSVPVKFANADASVAEVKVEPDAAKGIVRVTVENKSGKAFAGLRATVFMPPTWKVMRRAVDIGELAAGARAVREIELGERGRADWAEGDALYAAAADFTAGGGRMRAWGVKTVAGMQAGETAKK